MGKYRGVCRQEQAIFKKTTIGHSIVMGRKTYESIGRALPGRTNIIITRQKGYRAAGCVVVDSLQQAMQEAKLAAGSEEIFIIGGAQIYQQAMPMVDRIYLTKVHTVASGDTFFEFDESRWQEISKTKYQADADNIYDYDFITLVRKPK